jgi:putative nucleotidyltransferase with HDIG domain
MAQTSKHQVLLLFSYRAYRRSWQKLERTPDKNFRPAPAKARSKLLPGPSDKETMISLSNRPKSGCRPLDYKQIEHRLNGAPCLPSLGTIENALKELLSADQRYTTQIAEIIRRDPSLTSRLLHLVNSVYYGLANPIKNIEEAVFFLGVRQIRQLAMVTPIIEEFQKLAQDRRFPWRQFWRHCIGTALLTRELVDLVESPEGESDYVSGLIHDVGKIVMSSVFPEHFHAIYYAPADQGGELVEMEKEILGMDHAELGALYLQKQRLPEIFIQVARFHHHPDAAPSHAKTVAAVQVADLLIRHTKIGDSGNHAEVAEDSWMASAGWEILFAGQSDGEQTIGVASLSRSLARIPAILESIL